MFYVVSLTEHVLFAFLFHQSKKLTLILVALNAGGLCGCQEADHWHVFWDCPVIKPFWAEIHKTSTILVNHNGP